MTHWDSFAATPGNVVGGQDDAIACDHYHRYEADLDLMQSAGFDAYRFSTSWARVLREGRGAPNQAGLDFYDRLFDAMCGRGLKPMVTLYHWELPAALADLGGWLNPDIAYWFEDFAETILQRIGDRLFAVAPINEPYCIRWLGHFTGDHAPAQRLTQRRLGRAFAGHTSHAENTRALKSEINWGSGSSPVKPLR